MIVLMTGGDVRAIVATSLTREAARRIPIWRVGAVLVVFGGAGLLSPVFAFAQSASATYQVPRQSIDNGGGRATSASFTLLVTVGQPDVGATMTSARYILRGGFLVAAPLTPVPDSVFLDGFEAP